MPLLFYNINNCSSVVNLHQNVRRYSRKSDCGSASIQFVPSRNRSCKEPFCRRFLLPFLEKSMWNIGKPIAFPPFFQNRKKEQG